MKLPLLAYKCCCVEERDDLLRELKEKGVPVWEGSLPETAVIEYRVEPDFLFVKVGRTFGNSQRMLVRGFDAPFEEVVDTRQEFVQRLVDASRPAESRETDGTEGHFPSPPFKLRVSSNEEWEAVQKELFKQGYKWLSGGQTVQGRADGNYLYVDTSGFITYGCTYKYFKDHPYPEVDVSIVFPPAPEPIVRLTPKAQPRQRIAIGQRWGICEGGVKGEYILAEVDHRTVCLINLKDGTRSSNPVYVEDILDITDEEWEAIACGSTFYLIE